MRSSAGALAALSVLVWVLSLALLVFVIWWGISVLSALRSIAASLKAGYRPEPPVLTHPYPPSPPMGLAPNQPDPAPGAPDYPPAPPSPSAS